MDADWLDPLERKLGFLSLPNIPTFLTGMTALVAVLFASTEWFDVDLFHQKLMLAKFSGLLALDAGAVARGQVWRMFTFLVVPPPLGALGLVLWILMLYSVLKALESAWGEFKLTFFLLVGVAASTLGALATFSEFDNRYLILAAFLAFARLLPEREVYVMFILPVKLRWLAALAGLWTALAFLTSGLAGRLMILGGLAPYFLFFGEGHWRDLRYGWRRWRGGA